MTLTKLNLVLAASSLALITACSGTGGPNDNQNARNSAAIGAIGGAIIGAATADNARERRQQALTGLVAGAAIGGAIGNRLDQQEEELRRALGNNVGIVNDGNNLTVSLPENILFATNSTAVSPAAQSSLFTLANSLQRYPNTTVNVIGHTDNVGGAAFNLDLSQRRAQAVSSILINAGVSPIRIRSLGRGEDAPIATNLTPEGRAQNRRVDVVITPN